MRICAYLLLIFPPSGVNKARQSLSQQLKVGIDARTHDAEPDKRIHIAPPPRRDDLRVVRVRSSPEAPLPPGFQPASNDHAPRVRPIVSSPLGVGLNGYISKLSQAFHRPGFVGAFGKSGENATGPELKEAGHPGRNGRAHAVFPQN